MPAFGRDLLSRTSFTVVRDRIVSPWNTGFGNRVSLMPRLATVVPSVVSCTDRPITRPSVKMLLLAPLLTLFADIVGILGGVFIAYIELNIEPSFYFHEALIALRPIDFIMGISKTFIFGLTIGVTGCYYGLNTEGGTQGVGQATTKAVVTSSILIMIQDFLLTKVWWIYERGVQ